MGLGRASRGHPVPGKSRGTDVPPPRRGARWASLMERTGNMAGIKGNTPGFLPYDNAGLRARLAGLPLRTTSIEAELRALMAERREAEAEEAPKRRGRWS
jgi:hypothetical protein